MLTRFMMLKVVSGFSARAARFFVDRFAFQFSFWPTIVDQRLTIRLVLANGKKGFPLGGVRGCHSGHVLFRGSQSGPVGHRAWCRFRREARARERHRHCNGGSLKALDPSRPIRSEHARCVYFEITLADPLFAVLLAIFEIVGARMHRSFTVETRLAGSISRNLAIALCASGVVQRAHWRPPIRGLPQDNWAAHATRFPPI